MPRKRPPTPAAASVSAIKLSLPDSSPRKRACLPAGVSAVAVGVEVAHELVVDRTGAGSRVGGDLLGDLPHVAGVRVRPERLLGAPSHPLAGDLHEAQLLPPAEEAKAEADERIGDLRRSRVRVDGGLDIPAADALVYL